MKTPLTIGWWNDFAAAACGMSGAGEPPVIAASASDALTVETRADLSVVIHVLGAKLEVPPHLVRPLLGGLLHLDMIPLPYGDGNPRYHWRISDELSLELLPDAAVVIVTGADSDPASAIEVPGVQVERLKLTLRDILR